MPSAIANPAIGKIGQKKPRPEASQITTSRTVMARKATAVLPMPRLAWSRSMAAWRVSSWVMELLCDCSARAMIAEMGSEFRLMGVVNVTPDSFSDGGAFLDSGDAIAQGHRLAAEGADLLDIGGESTRPGAEAVDEDEELRRVLPVVEALAPDADATV